jgi:crotonobetainyl-CoA:carnitine CoA-transferase CaiB-like acyl-CoA transferase
VERDAGTESSPHHPLLEGVRVLSFCHWLQGPAACQYLADLGADVVKVEPLRGSAERHVLGPGRGPDGASSIFISANRNQRSVALDLKSDDGRKIVLDLLEHYDIVIENFRPGVMERLGLSYEQLSPSRPRLIYAGATGFGTSGPLSDKPGQDLLVQALSGLAASSGGRATGAAVADQHGASLLAMGVLAAVVRRAATGVGGQIEASLLNAGLDLQMEAFTFYLNRDDSIPWEDQLARHDRLSSWYHPAPYGVYPTQDGDIVISIVDLAVLGEAFPRLSDLGKLDPVTDRDQVAAAIADELARHDATEALELLSQAGVWSAPVLGYDEVEHHPQVVHSDIIAEVGDHKWQGRVVRHPVRYDGITPGVRLAPPHIGQHTEEILRSVGYTDDCIKQLLDADVIRAYQPTART